MQITEGGVRRPNKGRLIANRACALGVGILALAFPATAVGALAHGPRPGLAAAHRSAPPRGARLADAVLALGSGYASPDGSSQVRALQRQLERAGYPPGEVDGLFGPRTRQAVVAFQTSHGLQGDGVAGPLTRAALTAPVLILAQGAGDQPGGSAAVRSLQRRLAAAGDPPGPIDGRYGALTTSAVQRFQSAHGLRTDGIAGPRTFAHLTKPARTPSSAPSQRSRPPHSKPHAQPRHSNPLQAPRRRPVSLAPAAPRHSPGKGSLPWTILLSGLALVVAFALVAPLLYRRRQGDRRPSLSPPPRGDGAPVATAANGAATSATAATPDDAEAAHAFEVGQMLEERGNLAEARAAYARADVAGHGPAASNLGRLLEQEGALAEAEAAYRRADQRGDAHGAFNLGLLLDGRDARDEAAAAYRRAVDRGHDAAASNLGVLLEEQGAVAEAEATYRLADERGDAIAAFNLGVLLEERGASAAAAEAYRRAEQRGDVEVANMALAARRDLAAVGATNPTRDA
jgi:peptidoglycan hydrolase-like protein with peptidoglycan-binding domain